MPVSNPNCLKCKGEGRVKEKNGVIHVCYDCLQNGYLDQHDKNPKTPKDAGIRL